MLQRRQIVKALGNQIKYLVCAKDASTGFHSIPGCSYLLMLPYTGIVLLQRYETTLCILLTTKLLRRCI